MNFKILMVPILFLLATIVTTVTQRYYGADNLVVEIADQVIKNIVKEGLLNNNMILDLDDMHDIIVDRAAMEMDKRPNIDNRDAMLERVVEKAQQKIAVTLDAQNLPYDNKQMG